MIENELSIIKGNLLQGKRPVQLEISEGKISRIENIRSTGSVDHHLYVAPGLIDNQVNGYIGIDFTDPGLTVDKIKEVTKALWKTGVISYLPTIITGDPLVLKTNLAVLAEAMTDGETGPSIPGFHLEGPYISSEDGYRGAHNKRWVHPPDWNEFMDYNKAAQNRILQTTLAPELEGAPEFIRQAKKQGITIALGHHNASAEVIKEAAAAGAVMVTHLGNGCANMIHRHRNPIWPQLADDRLQISLIADGFHLTTEEVKTFYKVKGKDKVILISDMTKLAGQPPGEYMWNEKKVILSRNGLIRYPEQDVLAGSSMTLKKGVENMILFCSCPAHEAVQMATANPARLNRLNDRGVIEVGKRADLILFSLEDGRISIKKSILKGRVVYEAES